MSTLKLNAVDLGLARFLNGDKFFIYAVGKENVATLTELKSPFLSGAEFAKQIPPPINP